VDDKINARAAEQYPDLPLNEAIRKVTEETAAQFQADVKALGCLEPTHEPRATEYIEQMKEMIVQLYEADIAYVAEDHVLFSVAAYGKLEGVPAYGSLARRSLDEMIAGARVEVAPYKRDPMDFVLWKPSEEGEPGWPSPLGIATPGRPGWHLECSAMSKALLGDQFDIHGGGIDLVFPHHENEVAQSCAAKRTPKMANVWMHNGFLQVEGQKMSKSLGNFFTINELLRTTKFHGQWSGEELRLAMLMTHYRQPLDFTAEKLFEAASLLRNYQYAIRNSDPREPKENSLILEALSDDLNTPRVRAELDRLSKASRSLDGEEAVQAIDELIWSLKIIGFDDFVARNTSVNFDLDNAIADATGFQPNTTPDVIEEFIGIRNAARKAKNWAEADRIRDELAAQGIALKDAKDPETGEIVTTWEIAR
jgi:cysteinyl-tRNA synthetase